VKDTKLLKLLDDSIAEAVQEGRVTWVVALNHHAAILCRHTGDLHLTKRYYEKSLSSDAENPRALYGLAYVALEQGETAVARQYAESCYKTLLKSDDEIARQGLLDLIVKNWPDLAVR
jgi:Tfp pilus assembly protein PilF